MAHYDAILIPGGGVNNAGKPLPWVQSRLDHALKIRGTEYIITLSAGTVYKCPPRDENGFPVFESVAGAHYLIQHGVNPDAILIETSSYDTVGNAYFSRVIHVEPREFRRLLIITSEFHMARTQAIFQWMYGLDDQDGEYHLAFDAVEDIGIPADDLQVRRAKEAHSLKQFLKNTADIHSLRDCHRWLFTKHAAYAMSAHPTPIAGKLLNTY